MQVGKPLLNLNKYTGREHVRNPHGPDDTMLYFKTWQEATILHLQTRTRTSAVLDVYSIHVHHNTGTVVDTLNPFRDNKRFLYRNEKLTKHGTLRDYSNASWLKEFIKLVGKGKALEVTQPFRMNRGILGR
jgi:hypothetical protein